MFRSSASTQRTPGAHRLTRPRTPAAKGPRAAGGAARKGHRASAPHFPLGAPRVSAPPAGGGPAGNRAPPGRSPTCATSSPSFKYRIGAGWAGTRLSLRRPRADAPGARPPAAAPAPAPAPDGGARVPGRAGRRHGGRTRPAPGPQRSPSRGPARPGTPPACPQALARPPPAASAPLAAAPARLRGGRPPAPSARRERLRRLAASRRVLSAPPNLAPSLPPEPPFESAHAAPNLIGCRGRTRGTGAGRGPRARPRAGPGSWKSGLELAGAGAGAGGREPGAGGRGQGRGRGGGRGRSRARGPGGAGSHRARSAPSAAPRGASWESEFRGSQRGGSGSCGESPDSRECAGRDPGAGGGGRLGGPGGREWGLPPAGRSPKPPRSPSCPARRPSAVSRLISLGAWLSGLRQI